MTRTSNARTAGFAFLLYIAAGVMGMVVSARSAMGENIAEKLASIAQHVRQVQLNIVLGLVEAVCAILLAVTLYRITRDEDADLALLAMIFRVCEGLIGVMSSRRSLGLIWLASSNGPSRPSTATIEALGTYLFQAPSGNLAAIFFAMGSTLFAWLLLRGRMIPVPLAWLGVAASSILVVALPMQLLGYLSSQIASFLWIPMAAYEIPLAIWLIIKGAPAPTKHLLIPAMKP